MEQICLMMEFQLTQESRGQGTHLVYEVPMFKEALQAETYAKGKGSTIGKVIDGSLYNHDLNGMAGVSNVGNDINWFGHPFHRSTGMHWAGCAVITICHQNKSLMNG